MKSYILLPVTIAAMVTACSESNPTTKPTTAEENTVISAPVAKKIPHKMTIHGDTRIDDYYWMRDDQRKDKAVLEHLTAENNYADQMLAHTEDLQNKLFNELNGRIKKDDTTVPLKRRGYLYYRRYEGEQEYPIYARKPATANAQEQVLLNGNTMAEPYDYFAIGSYSVSTNNNLLAYSTDTVSRRLYTIQIKDLTTGQLYPEKLVDTSGSMVWANDNQTLFYIKKDRQTLLGYQVFRHKLGTSQTDDVLVYQEDNKSFYTGIGKAKDDSYIFIYHDSTTSKGVSMISADQPNQSATAFLPLEANHEYSIDKVGNWFYIRTNWQANDFKLMKAKLGDTADKTKWLEIIPHRADVYLQDVELFNDYLVVKEKVNGSITIKVTHWPTNKTTTLEFDDPVYVAGFTGNVDPSATTLRIYYSSMTTPMSTYDIDLVNDRRELLKQQEVLGDFRPEQYQSERIFVAARDGKKIPVSLVYRKDKFNQDGTNPLYQYGYGSYGSTNEPFFNASRLSLLDRGFVFAIAHIRGGQMLGRPWYEDGKMFNKKNTFTDFIDVTKALVELKYGHKDKVFAYGGSAGGLLMGAIINMNPELYRGVAAAVPFVDVVTTMLDESIPLTTNEYDEWGNPNNKDSYDYMKSYSPYDQITNQDYPNLLVTTGLHDSQVQYFEPMKWVAKLREYKTDNNTLLFKTDMDAGHGGASGRFRRNKERAMQYAFFLDLAGIKE
ncbi:MAG: S9 family peptidase [Kangiellaceae bacterium]|nr:S9 family peptidase [Kangiellaceae bacterium]